MEWITNLSADEMLRVWRLTHGYEVLLNDCSVECTEGVDLDSLLRHQVRAWYVRRILDMPTDELPLTEIASQVSLSRSDEGVGRVILPPFVLRVGSVEASGWEMPARIVTDPASNIAVAQLNPFSRARASRPVAVIHPDKSMMLYSLSDADSRIVSLKAVILPTDGSYNLTPTMLNDLYHPIS